MNIYKRNNGMNTDKLLRKLIAFVVVLAFIIPFITPQIFAASSINISGGDKVKGGDKFNVSVAFVGGNIGRVDAYMTYDTDKLTYISGGSSSGNTGYIQLKKGGTDGSVVFNIEFQAVSDGTATLEVKTNEMYDFEEMPLETPSADKSITITGNAASNQLITETTSPDKPVEETSLIGIDEAEGKGFGTGVYAVIIAVAVVLVILIIVISVALSRKKKKNNISDVSEITNNEANVDSSDKPRIGRSGKVLDTHVNDDDNWIDELMTNDGETDAPFKPNIYDRHEVRKRANEETELWREWDIDTNDDYEDIDKW